MRGPVEIHRDQLDLASKDLTEVSTRLRSDLESMRTTVAGYGEPWGGDGIGMLIGITHQVASELMFEKLDEVSGALDADGVAVKNWSESYRMLEEEASSLLKEIDGAASGSVSRQSAGSGSFSRQPAGSGSV